MKKSLFICLLFIGTTAYAQKGGYRVSLKNVPDTIQIVPGAGLYEFFTPVQLLQGSSWKLRSRYILTTNKSLFEEIKKSLEAKGPFDSVKFEVPRVDKSHYDMVLKNFKKSCDQSERAIKDSISDLKEDYEKDSKLDLKRLKETLKSLKEENKNTLKLLKKTFKSRIKAKAGYLYNYKDISFLEGSQYQPSVPQGQTTPTPASGKKLYYSADD